MRIAILATDNREHYRKYDLAKPYFGPPIEAILQGLSHRPDLELHVISCAQQPISAPEKLSGNIWFHLLHVPKIGWLRTGYQGCIRAIRRELCAINPDLVHGQGTERECALGAVFSRFPNVITIHGNIGAITRATKEPIGSYWWWMARLERFTLPRAGGVFCNSRHTVSLVQPRAHKTWLVPNALRLEFLNIAFTGRSKPSKPILLNIGTIAPLKQQLALVELADALHQQGHSFEFQFIGPADPSNKYASAFLERIKTAERHGFARYLGTKSLSELLVVLDTASALVHVPLEEAFGLVVAEALARNLKFFGFNVGGVPEIAAGIDQAELFPADDWEGLKSSIRRWLNNGSQPVLASAVMRERYHPEVIAQRHLEIYREVLAAS